MTRSQSEAIEPTPTSGINGSVKIAVVGLPTFRNRVIAERLIGRNVPAGTEVPVGEANVVLIFWNGEPGPEKTTIDQCMRDHRDIVAVKPDGTFTRIGFGNCIVSEADSE